MSDAARRDLLLLPGWSMPEQAFASLLPLLDVQWRVSVLPLPPADTLEKMAADILAAAPPRAVWFGWSLGGMVATQAALLAPARVAALVTLATNLTFVARPDWPLAMPEEELNAFSAGLDVDVSATLSRFDALQCRGGARNDLRLLRQIRTQAVADATRPALHDGLHVLRTADLRAPIASLSVPSLWLYGEHDALVPVAVAHDVRRLLPGAAVEVLAGAGHVAFLSAAQRVADFLNSLLTEPA